MDQEFETVSQAGGREFLVEWCALISRRSKKYYAFLSDEQLLAAYKNLLMQESQIMQRGDA